MNLHSIAAPAVAAINPLTIATLRASTGSTTAPDGKRVPSYAAPVNVACQVQSLQYNDILQLDALGIQGSKSKIYVNGRWEGIIRPDRRGGDLITMPDGRVYLVTLVLEDWPDWCCVAVTLQTDAA
jgi:hypothetical protein